ncbi:TPA_exp: Uncharacterized protein A8136_0167 [Trichophyton benhamiae CBS 112371]|nr:TPA_exp: Uncharacterized protein A8136_0167 [Trichophyton benhamiae CBS 112371]
MSTAVAPPTAAPLPPMVDRDRDLSPKTYPALAPLSTSRPSVSTPRGPPVHDYAGEKTTPDDKRSPNSSRRSGGPAPKISIKKESPPSPNMQTGPSRHRPQKLDLSSVASSQGPATARGPLTARDGLAMHDVGLACLSPGFQTQDPNMREQLQRSISVRDQQRSIIESRLQKSAKGDGPDSVKPSESNLFGSAAPKSSKKRPPPGLSIVAPSAATFADERVIQSAPLNQTFTGRHQPPPLTRRFINPPDFTASPQVNHNPANQTNNRLPPISDVFGTDALGPRDRDRDRDREANSRNGFGPHSQSNNHGPLPSPSIPANQPNSAATKRPREYRSAEEAVHELAGGREDLLPRIVHYSGNRANSPRSPAGAHNGNGEGHSSHPPQHHQPHTSGGPPSSQFPSQSSLGFPGSGARRRTRNEYEQDHGSPPLGNGPEHRYRPPTSHGPFGAGRDSPDTQRRKKEEFLSLCARAWDLFHS